MRRIAWNHLLEWKDQPSRKPLILNGARQVGKTYIVEQFAKEHFKKPVLIDFKEQATLKSIFTVDLDPQRIINELSVQLNRDIDLENDLIFFDEIQTCPEALSSLKYFYKSFPKSYFCAAGSLLGLGLNPDDFPVGKVNILNLYPMNFEEFLWALGEEKLAHYLSQNGPKFDISKAAHDKTWNLLKHYFVTGGLPEVVSTYVQNKNTLNSAFQKCRTLQKTLLSHYMNDFAKHSGNLKSMRIEAAFKSIPLQLARESDGRLQLS